MMIGGLNQASIDKANEQDEKNYLLSGSQLEQSLHAIKIVKAFGQETLETEKFEKHLIIDRAAKRFYTILYAIS